MTMIVAVVVVKERTNSRMRRHTHACLGRRKAGRGEGKKVKEGAQFLASHALVVSLFFFRAHVERVFATN